MALYTRCIFLPRLAEDGTRISVMSRHTLDDGLTPDPRILPDVYDEWLRILAPPAKLVGDYYKRSMPWEQYSRRYVEFLHSVDRAADVALLASRALDRDITLLCVEESAEFCHRRLLAEECVRIERGLSLVHR